MEPHRSPSGRSPTSLGSRVPRRCGSTCSLLHLPARSHTCPQPGFLAHLLTHGTLPLKLWNCSALRNLADTCHFSWCSSFGQEGANGPQLGSNALLHPVPDINSAGHASNCFNYSPSQHTCGLLEPEYYGCDIKISIPADHGLRSPIARKD